ncbi:MAG: HFX_2341 family transcriptional regulator domain-containing protein [Candidatus Nitrosopumilus sp. bin_32a]
MAKIAKLRVHIAPVGYEIDRIVLSAKQERADRVWLLLHENKSDDKAGPFVTKITTQLEKLHIEIKEEYHDRRDLFKIIRAVKNIMDKEKGNEIYVNLASGSKIQAIGTMMACMMFNDDDSVHPYYVEAANYPGFDAKKPLSTGIKEIVNVPPYSIKTPDQKLVSALQIITEHNGKLTKKEMAVLSEEKELITINAKEKNHSMARYASLDKNIIQPLKEWEFISVEKIGRNHWIEITEEGKNASEFLI